MTLVLSLIIQDRFRAGKQTMSGNGACVKKWKLNCHKLGKYDFINMTYVILELCGEKLQMK